MKQRWLRQNCPRQGCLQKERGARGHCSGHCRHDGRRKRQYVNPGPHCASEYESKTGKNQRDRQRKMALLCIVKQHPCKCTQGRERIRRTRNGPTVDVRNRSVQRLQKTLCHTRTRAAPLSWHGIVAHARITQGGRRGMLGNTSTSMGTAATATATATAATAASWR